MDAGCARRNTRMPSCPACASEHVRRSRRKPALEFLKRWRGLRRYRCTECGKVFHEPLAPGELITAERMRRARQRRSSQQLGLLQTKLGQHVAEAALFGSMLAIFYFALKYFEYGS